MAIIPSGQKFSTLSSSLNTVERGSATVAGRRNTYSMSDVVETIGFHTEDKVLTSDNLLDLNGGGSIEIIEAPGAGKVISIISIVGFLDFNSTAFNFNESLLFRIGTNTQSTLTTSTINSSADLYFTIGGEDYDVTLPNTALTLFADTSATVTTGDSPLNLRIAYRIVDFS